MDLSKTIFENNIKMNIGMAKKNVESNELVEPKSKKNESSNAVTILKSERAEEVKKYLKNKLGEEISRSDLIKHVDSKRKAQNLSEIDAYTDKDVRRIIKSINEEFIKSEEADSYHISINRKNKTYKYELSAIGIIRNAIQEGKYITFDYVSKRKVKRDYRHIAPISIDGSKKYFYAYRIEINEHKKHVPAPNLIKRFYFDRIKEPIQICKTEEPISGEILKMIEDAKNNFEKKKIVFDDFGYLSQVKPKDMKTLSFNCTDYFVKYLEKEHNELYKKLCKKRIYKNLDKSDKRFINNITINFVDYKRLLMLFFGNLKHVKIVNLKVQGSTSDITLIKGMFKKYIEPELKYFNS